MKYIPKTIALLILLLIFNFFFFNPVITSAQDVAENKIGFTLSPPSNEYGATPGETLTGIVKVTNFSEESFKLIASAESFVAFGDTGQVTITDEDPSYSIKKWIKIDDPEKTVKPRSELTFNYTIDIPKNAEPGGHYGAIVVSNKPPDIKGQSVAKVQQSIGSLILIKLPGDVSDQTNLVSFKSDKDYYSEPLIKLNTIVENVGNVHSKVSGEIDIYDIFNNKVKTLKLESKNVLPGNKRAFEVESDFDLIGPYTAKLNMVYGTNKEINGTTTFWTFNTEKIMRISGIVTLIMAIILGQFYLMFIIFAFILRKR